MRHTAKFSTLALLAIVLACENPKRILSPTPEASPRSSPSSTETPEQATGARSSAPAQVVLLYLYGGRNSDVYLGCLTCNKFCSESVFNEFGRYGSKFSSTSIWNEFGTYGSELSQYSPWNQFALHPPIIVDASGNFYGRLTVNQFHYERTRVPEIVCWLERRCPLPLALTCSPPTHIASEDETALE